MKVIIAGSRSLNLGVDEIEEVVSDSGFELTELVCGMATKGIDACALRWAKERKIPVLEHPADWGRFGNRAGPIRNRRMIDAGAEALIAIWDLESPGTRDMIFKASEARIPVFLRAVRVR